MTTPPPPGENVSPHRVSAASVAVAAGCVVLVLGLSACEEQTGKPPSRLTNQTHSEFPTPWYPSPPPGADQ